MRRNHACFGEREGPGKKEKRGLGEWEKIGEESGKELGGGSKKGHETWATKKIDKCPGKKKRTTSHCFMMESLFIRKVNNVLLLLRIN